MEFQPSVRLPSKLSHYVLKGQVDCITSLRQTFSDSINLLGWPWEPSITSHPHPALGFTPWHMICALLELAYSAFPKPACDIPLPSHSVFIWISPFSEILFTLPDSSHTIYFTKPFLDTSSKHDTTFLSSSLALMAPLLCYFSPYSSRFNYVSIFFCTF